MDVLDTLRKAQGEYQNLQARQNRAPQVTDFSLFYDIRPGNWYKTFPFFFEIMDQIDDTPVLSARFFLPIPPQNMTVQDLSTSEAHATIGGVVEETTSGVFSLITMVGTTGLSSSQTDLTRASTDLNPQFRKYLDDLAGRTNPVAKLVGSLATEVVNGIVDRVAAFATGETSSLPYQNLGSAVPSSNIDSLENTKRSVSELFPRQVSGGQKPGFFGALANALASSVGLGDTNADGFRTPFANGFSWSHALRQLFLVYQREKSKNNNLALYFVDAKAGTRYRCVVRSAQFTQNARNPYLISYNISLKCWEISNTEGGVSDKNIDRFAEGGDLAVVNVLNATAVVTATRPLLNAWTRPGSVAGSMVKSSTASII